MRLLIAFLVTFFFTIPLFAQGITYSCVAFEQSKYFSPYYSLRINNVEQGRYADKYGCIKAEVKDMKKRDKQEMKARKKQRTEAHGQLYSQRRQYSAPGQPEDDELEREWYDRTLQHCRSNSAPRMSTTLQPGVNCP